MKQIAIKYSGGTDSTAATALVAEQYDRVHLITYKHSGISNIGNSGRNIEKLKEIYGSEKFSHTVMDTDKLFRTVTYADYFQLVRKFGFFNLGSCGLCKLAMHIRTIVYCLDNGITSVADGANKNSDIFPAQMAPVLSELRGMYKRYGIEFVSPVFNYEFPEEIDWKHKFGLVSKPKKRTGEKTTGQVLFERGITPAENVKGTETDRKMQGLCFQLILLNLFALKYYIPKHGMEKYTAMTAEFYKEKISRFTRELDDYVDKKPGNLLSKVID